jgi:hypothetical protein
VTSNKGEPVEYAVVHAMPEGGAARQAASSQEATVDQVDKRYVSYVTAVRVGTEIAFPNRDQIRHHVYSFSGAKTLEIPLYKGPPRSPWCSTSPGP